MYDHLKYKVQMKCKYMLCLNVDPTSKLPCEVCASISNSEMSSPLLVPSRAIGTLNLFYIMTLSMGFVHALCRQIAELFCVPSVGCVCSSPSAFMMLSVSVSLQPLLQARSWGVSCPRVENLKPPDTAAQGSNPEPTVQCDLKGEHGILLYNSLELSAVSLIISDFPKSPLLTSLRS